MLNGIVCVSKNWGIGKNNNLLFNLKKDMEFFKEMTKESIVVMGENTLLSLPKQKPLKNRVNFVLCPAGHEYDGCICIHDFNELLKIIIPLSKLYSVYIIGGGMMYNSMLPYYEQVFVTKVDKEVLDAEVFFPNLDSNDKFELIAASEKLTEDNLDFKFIEYRRKSV